MNLKNVVLQFHDIEWLTTKLTKIPPLNENPNLKNAAVLIPIILHQEPTLLLTKRTEHLYDHPGQVSFPGGRVEDTDCDASATALRETYEEIGIPADKISLVGYLPQNHQVLNYNIIAIVGLISPPLQLKLDSFEVASAFEVPLELILNRQNFAGREIEHNGIKHYSYFLDYQGYNIWGATARMILSLAELISITNNANTNKTNN